MMITQEQQDRLQEMMQQRAAALRDDIKREAQAQDDYLATATEVNDPGDASFASLTVDVANAEATRDLFEIRGIEAALARMDEGEYGTCVQCGVDIPYARLEVQPTADRCVPCQENYEKTHADPVRGGTM